MNGWKKENITQLVLTLMILLSGGVMVAFVDIPAEAISWELLAGAYEPSLDVDEDSGAPGSIFAFTGSGYPPNSQAVVYVDGRPVGSLMTDAGGMATFTLNTTGAAEGAYNVTLEVDINASATESIELRAGEPTVTPPPGFEGPNFNMQTLTYLSVIVSQ